jgi:CubicO group peptidase (beta-lactamase class C family)
MPGGSRSLPGRPSLRYLRLEAKRRLAAGEFSALHQVQLSGLRYLAAVDSEPPHRLIGLQGFPVAERITDPRLPTTPKSQNAPKSQNTPPNTPQSLPAIADDAVTELGLPALIVAGGEPGTEPWVLARGRPDLDNPEPLDPSHRFPAPGVTALVTATAVLCLVAQARLNLDTKANEHLSTIHLENDAITVRDLLTHTSGVEDPTELYGDSVREVAAIMGPVISCPGPRGQVRPGNGAYAVLGQLVADVTGAPFAGAVTRLVLDPLGMRDSSFPRRAGGTGPRAVTTYQVTAEGIFVPAPEICTVQPVAGLWSTGADLVRLGTGWPSLLPASLAREALTPQAELEPGTYATGLSWLIDTRAGIATHQGMGLDSAATLVIRVRDYRTHVVLTNRQMTLKAINDHLRHSWTTS